MDHEQHRKVHPNPPPYQNQTPELAFLNRFNGEFVVYTSADFLYWKAFSDGLNYAVTIESARFNPGSRLVRTGFDTKQAKFPWEPAFRVAAGFSQSSWDTSLLWTFYRSKDTRLETAETLGTGTVGPQRKEVIRQWVVVNVRNKTADYLQAEYKIRLNTIDWEIGRSVSYHGFVFRPLMGVRGAFLDQKMKIFAQAPNATGEGQYRFSNVKLENDFRGVGVRGGANSRYAFNEIFSFYLNGSASLLLGRFQLTQREIFTPGGFPTFTFIDSTSIQSKTTVKPVFQIATGANVGYTFHRMQARIEVTAGYEFQAWLDQNQLVRVINNANTNTDSAEMEHSPGDVGFHGLIIQTAFYY
jgi:hypothetical protein